VTQPADSPRAARLYHTLSSYGWYDEPVITRGADVESVPPTTVDPEALVNLASLLRSRSSQRGFTGAALTVDQLLAVLWCGYGSISAPDGLHRATVPSAGGLYPLALAVLPLAVDGLDCCVHVFDPATMTVVSGRDLDRPRVEDWFRTHHVDFRTAAAVVIVMADIDEPVRRYGERGYRYVLLEAGHVVQNVALAAAASGLGAVALGGFDDEVVNAAVGPACDGRVAVYSVAIGGVDSPDHPYAAIRVIDSIRNG